MSAYEEDADRLAEHVADECDDQFCQICIEEEESMKPRIDIQTAREYAITYRKLLRQAKRAGISFTDGPADVQAAALALHQNALRVQEHDRRKKKAAEIRKREEN